MATNDEEIRARQYLTYEAMELLGKGSDGSAPLSRSDLFSAASGAHYRDVRADVWAAQVRRKPWQQAVLGKLVTFGLVAEVRDPGGTRYIAADRKRIAQALDMHDAGQASIDWLLWPDGRPAPTVFDPDGSVLSEQEDESPGESPAPASDTAERIVTTLVGIHNALNDGFAKTRHRLGKIEEEVSALKALRAKPEAPAAPVVVEAPDPTERILAGVRQALSAHYSGSDVIRAIELLRSEIAASRDSDLQAAAMRLRALSSEIESLTSLVTDAMAKREGTSP